MPCRLLIKVRSAKGLPIMDKASESADPYVEVKFANLPPQKTKICPKTLNPQWKQSFQFEVQRDKHLQDAPVEFKVFDHDVVHDDVIGSVVVDISCLLVKRGPSHISGWFPLYDSIRGIRGALNLSVSLEFVDNSSKFRDISAGVRFYSVSSSLGKYKIVSIIGFVEELIVEDDPEYHFSFSKARTTNDQRQNIFYHIAGKLRRKIGITVQDLGGNAVLGYRQHFDLEGDSGKGIVARGYGTACILSREAPSEITPKISPSPSSVEVMSISPRSLITEQRPSNTNIIFTFNDEVHLISLKDIPSFFHVQIGGIVAVRSVKILKKSHRRRNRDKWWAAIRSEIRSHASALKCDSIFGYTETTTIEDDIVILSAVGTACKVTLIERESNTSNTLAPGAIPTDKKKRDKKKKKKKKKKKCSSFACHLPYDATGAPYAMKVKLCNDCNKATVGEILLANVEPHNVSVACPGVLLQARVCRKLKKKTEGKENMATAVSEQIPFLEYDLHQQILYKLRALGANACFSLQFQINLGPSMIVAVATGTALLVQGLPLPRQLPDIEPSFLWKYHYAHEQFSTGGDIPDEDVVLDEYSLEDEESISEARCILNPGKLPLEKQKSLIDPPLPEGLQFSCTQKDPYCIPSVIDSKLIISFVRIRWEPPAGSDMNSEFATIFQQNYHKLIFELCNSMPCTLCGLQFQVCLPGGENEIDFLVTGTALQYQEAASSPILQTANGDMDSSMIFPLEHSEGIDLKSSTASCATESEQPSKSEPERRFLRSPQRSLNLSLEGLPPFPPLSGGPVRDTVMITNLEYIPGYKIKKYIGRISHHLIREPKQETSMNIPGKSKLGNLASLFLREAISVARSHVIGMGGDALIGFQVDSFDLIGDTGSTGYCLISFSGDAVLIRKKRSLEDSTRSETNPLSTSTQLASS